MSKRNLQNTSGQKCPKHATYGLIIPHIWGTGIWIVL